MSAVILAFKAPVRSRSDQAGDEAAQKALILALLWQIGNGLAAQQQAIRGTRGQA